MFQFTNILVFYLMKAKNSKVTLIKIRKASVRIVNIKKNHNLKEMIFSSFEKLFKSFVAPVLDYISGVWIYQNTHSLDQVMDHAIRYFLVTHKLAPLLAIRGYCGLAPASSRHNQQNLKQFFMCDKNSHNERSWSRRLKSSNRQIWLIYTKTQPSATSNNILLFNILYWNTWLSDLENSAKLRTHRLIKGHFIAENYVLMDIKKHEIHDGIT